MNDTTNHSRLPPEIDNKVIQRIVADGPETRNNKITVGDVFNLLVVKGLKTKAIRRLRPDIKPETIALTRAFIISARPDIYRQLVDNDSADYRMLVDEALPARIIPAIRQGFSYATHTNFVGLNGKGRSHPQGDQDLWVWAVNNNIDAIVTRDYATTSDDQDLTAIALADSLKMIAKMDETARDSINLDELPLIIHIKSEKADYKTIAKIFTAHQQSIQSYLETRSTPFIMVTENGVKSGPTYIELWDRYLQQQTGNYETIPRRDRQKEQWKRSILGGRQETDLSPYQRQRIDQLVNAAAAVCSGNASARDREILDHRKGVRRKPSLP